MGHRTVPVKVAFPARSSRSAEGATNNATEEGGNVRVGDYSHLPVGFEIKAARRAGDRRAAWAAKPKTRRRGRGRRRSRPGPCLAPRGRQPSSTARKATTKRRRRKRSLSLATRWSPRRPKLVSYGIKNRGSHAELPAPGLGRRRVDEAAAEDDADAAEDDESDSTWRSP